MTRILICDDDSAVRFTVEDALTSAGFETVQAENGTQALDKLEGIDVVVTDLAMPEMDGLALLKRVHLLEPELPVVLLTAHGSERIAVEAMKAGAWDYLPKPFSVDELRLVVSRAAEASSLRRSVRQHSSERALGKPLVGDSPAFRAVVNQTHRVAGHDVTVLVRGETGTGKELIGSLLHAASRRSAAPLVRFNCAAITADLAEAELFGHHKGAFTGATTSRRGLFREAHLGTLVLDEVAELPMAVQAKLLRAIQEGEVRPVGATAVERVDVRLVSCTHRDLLAEVKAGRFREDLYYRLAVVELRVPPLRERRADIPALIDCFRIRYSERFGLQDTWFTSALTSALTALDWPGNVRELENAVARLLALSDGGTLDVDALDRLSAPPTPGDSTLRGQLDAFEKTVLETAMSRSGGNQSAAARQLRISRTTLLDKLKRFGLAGT